LFVATTLVNGSYYYAVTTLINNIENLTIVSGTNSLANAVSETVSKPMPVLQEIRTISNLPIEIYTSFISSKFAADQPLMLKAGFVAVDFSVNRNNASGSNPLRIYFHSGGKDYLESIQKLDGDEVRVNIEDNFPDRTLNSAWWGSNPEYDIYKTTNNVVAPTTGINNNYSQQRVNDIIDWAINQLPIDSNRIYINATSRGSGPAFIYAITYPERIAAVKVNGGIFDFGFYNDWQSTCTLNPEKKNRVEADLRYGTVATNLMCNLGIRTYEALNGGWMIHEYPTRDYPFIYSNNGKMDDVVGWTEKTIFYDSLNRNHLGGYFFWDNRDHGGNTGQTWDNSNFDLYRFRRNVSFPAFAFCSLNEDFGNGNGLTGEDHGTINGALNWSDNIIDNAQTWQIKVFVRNLLDKNDNIIVYPDSCTADVTPRRLQNFPATPDSTLYWQVIHLGQTVQSGSINYQGVLIVIPQVKIFRDTSTLILSTSSQQNYYLDSDSDGFGDPLTFMQASSQPAGYVSSNTDCNDQNSQVHPAAPDICNGIDDNCNGVVDDKAPNAIITPSGSISVCKGTVITLTAGTGPEWQYQWKKGSNNIAGATASSYSTTKTESGSFSVVITAAGGCSATSAATTITRMSLPAAIITSLGNLDICSSGQVTLQATSGSGYKYQWQKNSVNISGATNQNYVATAVGSYKVIVTGSNGCKKTSTVIKVTKSCKLAEAGEVNESEISFFPNPNNGTFDIVLKNFDEENFGTLSIFDLSGRMVYQQQIEISGGEFSRKIKLSDKLGDGVFLVEFITNESKHQQMMVVSK
ncbi:MAG: T9SS type A sorting domain-containing protein, partial [Chitinophagales bacterium]|nr:T9SS type A sorting domain-containing protein [Chitinophagales bacterium]